MKRSSIVEIISILFVMLFLYSIISKIIDYTIFKELVSTSPILAPVAALIAWILPLLEFIIVGLLIVPRWRLKGLYASLALMVIFTIYIICLLLFNNHIPCSCGGVLERLSWPQHIVFNVLFISLALIGVLLEKQYKNQSKLSLSLIAKH